MPSRRIERASAKHPEKVNSILMRILACALKKENQREPLVYISRRLEVAELPEPDGIQQSVVPPHLWKALNAGEQIAV
jgi:hypothetical protein